MKSKWFVTLFAAIPFAAGIITLQSCAGKGGAVVAGGGLPGVTEQFRNLMSDDQKSATYAGADSCAAAACHGTDPHDEWQATKHAAKGVSCERCHGPGSAHNAAPTKDNIISAPKVTNPVVCAQCHGPVYEQWQLSKHSQLILSPVEEAVQQPDRYGRTSRCVACHSGLFRSDVVDAGVDIPSMTDAQVQEVAEDTINVVPHVATCATCHDPHKQTGNLTDTGKEVQLRHKTFNTDTAQVGPSTTPAQFTTFDHSCAECHNGRGTDPSDAKLATGTSRPSMHDSNQFQMLMGFGGSEGSGAVKRNTSHATAPGQCSKCHMPDSRHTFTTGYDVSCSPCHTADDAAARVTSVKNEITGKLLTLRSRMEAWSLATFGDKDLWDYTSLIVAEGKTPPDQTLVPIQIKRARHNYYFVIRDSAYGPHNAPYANFLLDYAGDNLTALGYKPVQVPNIPVSQRLKMLDAVREKAVQAELTDK